MNQNTINLTAAIISGSEAQKEQAFKAAISEKILAALDIRKQMVADKIFNGNNKE